MIRTKADLEKIKQKVAPLLYLRTPQPAYKFIFHYSPENRALGVDELVNYTIEKLRRLDRLDCVVLRIFQDKPTATITMSIVEKNKTTLYHNLNQQVIDQIIDSHLRKGTIVDAFTLKTKMEDLK